MIGDGCGRGCRACGGKAKAKEWMPITELGQPGQGHEDQVPGGDLFLLPAHEESEIIDFFLGASLKHEVLKIMLVPKQTCAGQRTRFKALVAVGDYNGHRLLGTQVGQAPHHPLQVDRLLQLCAGAPHPCARDTGIVSTLVAKKLLMMASTYDCHTSAEGCTATLGNFAKATFDAVSKTYSYLTPDLWKETGFTKSPYHEFTDHLVKTHPRVYVQRTQAPTVATA
ncbi:hypothetical protein H8958_014384 [Nasalis larvatus]